MTAPQEQIIKINIDISSQAYQYFINSLKSKSTRRTYSYAFKKYLVDNKITIETLLKLPVGDSEQLLINYIERLKSQDISHSSINLLFCVVKHFCIMNNIRINDRKIAKFLGESGRKNTDRGYNHAEIKKLLDVSDLRMKSVILLMASSGMRVGPVTDLKLKHLEEIPNEKTFKITVYEKSKDEYYCFCSHECYSVIKSYLDHRTKSGEILDGESYLIREQFDITDFEQIRKKSRKIASYTLKNAVQVLLVKSGLRQINHNYKHGDRHEIPMNHGFRKFWTTEAIKAKMNPEFREMMLGCNIGHATAYCRPTTEEMLEEYLKAVDNFTIEESNRLKKKVTELESKQSEIDLMKLKHETEMKAMNQQMERLESTMSDMFSKISGNLNQLTGIETIDKERMKKYGFNPSTSRE